MMKHFSDRQAKETGRPHSWSSSMKKHRSCSVRFVATVGVLFLQKCCAYVPMVDDLTMIETIPASWVMENEARSSSSMISTTASSASAYYNDPGSMRLEHVKEALEYTSQLNHRLQENAQEDRNYTVIIDEEDPSSSSPASSKPTTHHFRGGGGGCSTSTRRVPLDDVPEQSIDHGKTIFLSRSNEPLLEIVLKRALDAVPAANKDMLLTLALVYLDRACSVETHRPMTIPPCPFCAPDTIRRLFLSAVLIAARANGFEPDYTKLDQWLGISRYECEDMMAMMTASLGEPGVFVTPEELQSFAMVWQTRFPTSNAI